MNREFEPSDSRPDPELGRMLHEALTGEDETRFVSEVMARLEGARSPDRAPSWDTVLGGWARAGIAAALLLAAFGSWLVTRIEERGAGLSVPETLIAAEAPAPQTETVVSALFDEE